MESYKSSNPLFVDFFYAVVVGSTFSYLTLDNATSIILIRLFMIFVILEDWYVYHRYVISFPTARKKYTIRSFLFEISMLLFWYFSFISIPERLTMFLILYSLFFLTKLYAGISHYMTKQSPITKEAILDFFYLVPAISSFLVYFLAIKNYCSVTDCYSIVIVFWAVTIVSWWSFKLNMPEIE